MCNAAEIDLAAFHAGQRATLAAVYRRHVAAVERAASRYCRGVEAEGVTHDVFALIVERADVRQQFTGGNMQAWLCTIAARRAIDLLRRQRRWTLLDDPRSLEGKLEPVDEEQGLLHRDQLRWLEQGLRAFATEALPSLGPRLGQVFELRFVERVSQVEAARRLGLARSTLMEREQKLVGKLGRFLRRWRRRRR